MLGAKSSGTFVCQCRRVPTGKEGCLGLSRHLLTGGARCKEEPDDKVAKCIPLLHVLKVLQGTCVLQVKPQMQPGCQRMLQRLHRQAAVSLVQQQQLCTHVQHTLSRGPS